MVAHLLTTICIMEELTLIEHPADLSLPQAMTLTLPSTNLLVDGNNSLDLQVSEQALTVIHHPQTHLLCKLMEKVIEEQEPLLNQEQNSNGIVVINNNKGGFRTLPLIIANEACEKVASIGLMPNMIMYLTKEYNMQTTEATKFILLWSAVTNFTSLIAAFHADSHFGRYSMIVFGSLSSLLRSLFYVGVMQGMILLWLTTIISLSRPICSDNCNSATTIHLLMLHSSFALMSIGAGGIRSSSLAFGVDQLSKHDENSGIKEGYFSWYYASTGVSSLLGLSVVVYVQDNMGWTVGFGVPVILMFIATLSFFLATPFYVKVEAKRNVLSSLALVLVASYRNRLLQLPQENMNVNGIYHHERIPIS